MVEWRWMVRGGGATGQGAEVSEAKWGRGEAEGSRERAVAMRGAEGRRRMIMRVMRVKQRQESREP